MRRLPVYILIDTSGSMKGEPIESVKVGLETMIADLRQDPFALESAYLSIITFDREVNQLVPLTALDRFRVPEIVTPESGPTHTGAALEMLCGLVDREVFRGTADRKGDWMPLLFLMTDGKPSDIQLYNRFIPEIHRRKFASIVACAAGPKANPAPLKLLTEHVFALDTVDSATLKNFFRWVSRSIGVGNRSVGSSRDVELPPPPEELNKVA